MALAPGDLVAEAPRVGEDEDPVHGPRLGERLVATLAGDPEVGESLLDAVEVLLVVDAPAEVGGLVLLAGVDLQAPLRRRRT